MSIFLDSHRKQMRWSEVGRGVRSGRSATLGDKRLRECKSEVSDAFSNVCVDALITIAKAAGVKDFATDTFDIVRSNGIREDGSQIIDAKL